MVICKSVDNLLTKEKINCDIFVVDKISFMKDNAKNQAKYIIYLYEFSSDDKYLVINDNKIVIKKIKDQLALKFLDHIYNIERLNKNSVIDSIINSLNNIIKKSNTKIRVNEEKLRLFLGNLENHKDINKIYEARNKYLFELKSKKKVVQEGGILIWAMEKYLFPKLPETVQLIFWSILEIIDVILIFADSIPGLQLVGGTGIVINVVTLIWAILRFNIVMMIGAIISFIPVAGNIVGGVIMALNEAYQYYRKFKSSVGEAKRFVRVGKTGYVTTQDIYKDYKKGQISQRSVQDIEMLSSQIPALLAKKQTIKYQPSKSSLT